MVLTLINGHEITHLFDSEDSCEEICLVCQVQENQQEEAFLLPSEVQVKEPLRTLVHLEQMQFTHLSTGMERAVRSDSQDVRSMRNLAM